MLLWVEFFVCEIIDEAELVFHSAFDRPLPVFE
jgi:hypothetical protein